MKKIYLSLIVLFGMGYSVSAQTADTAVPAFVPNGKPIVTIFSDFTNNTTKNATGTNTTNNAFELTRAYFGYGYNFSTDFSAKVLFDVANNAAAGTTAPGVSAFTVFAKNAYGEYNHGMVTADLGLVGDNMFSLQESIWGKRYIYKSFQDQYGFGNSADLGAKVKIQFIPEVSLDLQVLNGEGYKKVQADSTFKFAAGLTVQPIKNLFARIYYDNMANQKLATTKVAQSSLNFFLGYKSVQGTIAAEYNTQNGHANTKDNNWSGISVYGTLPIVKMISVYARFDDLSSDKISKTTGTNGVSTTTNLPWNSGKTGTDGQVYMVGVEFAPVKGIQITPNFRYATPSSDAKTAGASAVSTINVNLGVNF